MRNPDRLDKFYEEIKELHKKYLSDWRFQQLILNYLSWFVGKYGTDGFYIEEDKCIESIKEFFKFTIGERFDE